MTVDWVTMALSALLPPGAAWLVSKMPSGAAAHLPDRGFHLHWVSCAAVVIFLDLEAGHDYPAATTGIAGGLLALFLWWFNRRRRDKVKALLGAKARALLAALVRTMNERSVPRRVLAPRGAGA